MSAVDVVNRALLKLGDPEQLTSLTQTGSLAKVANLANTHFGPTYKAELREHPWNFAKTRISIAADADYDPSDGPARRFLLPANFIRLADNEADLERDWRIESGYIYTDDASPLYIVYIRDEGDTAKWDPLFFDAVACKFAEVLAPWRTASRTKASDLIELYERAVRKAKRINAIDNVPADPPEDNWIAIRRT
jgi:hypothetical protein